MEGPSQQDIVVALLVGSAGMLLLVGGIFTFVVLYQKRILLEHKKQKDLEEKYTLKMAEEQVRSQEMERSRIAAELHDSVGSLLWGAKLNAGFLEQSSQMGEEQKQSYMELMNALDQSIDTVRDISWELTPQAFQQSGLSKSVQRLCNRVNIPPLSVHFEETGSKTWNNHRALSVFRIIQELINNAIKHSNARLLKVKLTWSADELILTVIDDGVGFTLEQERTGVGWWNINQRIRQLSAKISIGIPPMHGGTIITLIIPLLTDITEHNE